MRRTRSCLLAGSLVTWAATLTAQMDRRVTRLADGVYAIEHQDAGDGFASGNTTVIIGTRQVLVVDAGFLPSDAREDIDQIHRWTSKPVSFLINTHFHNDHNLGNRVYLDAYPAVTIIAQAETKQDMDRFGPGSAARVARGQARLQQMLTSGKTESGRALTGEERDRIRQALTRRSALLKELNGLEFQSATLTFEQGLTVDVGGREIEIRFLGRGNTAGDAVVYLPRERIVVTGDLVVSPVPYVYDGYPSEWSRTLERLAQLNAETIVPGHGPVMHDNGFVLLTRDLLQSAVDQLNAELVRSGPAMSGSLEAVRKAVDLSPFRARFAGTDGDLGAAFDDMAAHLIKVAFAEASLR